MASFAGRLTTGEGALRRAEESSTTPSVIVRPITLVDIPHDVPGELNRQV